jgi:hypothetical protein
MDTVSYQTDAWIRQARRMTGTDDGDIRPSSSVQYLETNLRRCILASVARQRLQIKAHARAGRLGRAHMAILDLLWLLQIWIKGKGMLL